MKKLFYIIFILAILTIVIGLLALLFGHINLLLMLYWTAFWTISLIAIAVLFKILFLMIKANPKNNTIVAVCPECGKKGSSKSRLSYIDNTYYALCDKCGGKNLEII